jgi:C-terminal processing protease CtpA/Prc
VVPGFDSLFAGLAKTEALILDLRDNGGGNSAVGFALLGYLTEQPFLIAPCTSRDYRPVRRALGLKNDWHKEAAVEWPASGSRSYLKPVVVLIGPRTGSAAEDFCVAFRVMQRGNLIGEPTAGSTGQPLVFGLPGGGNATVCTAHCTYPDGTEFVGIGIRPDTEVHPTVSEVRAGRDAALEAAEDYVRHGLGGTRSIQP